MREVKTKLLDKSSEKSTSGQKDGTERRRVRQRRRQTLDAAQISDSSAALFDQQENETNLLRSSSMSNEGIATTDGGGRRSRTMSPSSESEGPGSSANHSGDGAPPATRRSSGNSIIESLQESKFRSSKTANSSDGEHTPIKLTRPKQLNATESHKLSNRYESEAGKDRLDATSPSSREGRRKRWMPPLFRATSSGARSEENRYNRFWTLFIAFPVRAACPLINGNDASRQG